MHSNTRSANIQTLFVEQHTRIKSSASGPTQPSGLDFVGEIRYEPLDTVQ